eukprot:CAMPEP_0170517008 /NCGR_PEP_ID=MMETSP0209-20121228/3106_1 /TAXON_ID=665100 ORGANISM="Litonotus pictus, Strain P1" /NCGR_SAMPLE_ID=MMETSP0209 /ASSEMBLY_ACC=CAM_ASM_000301 /LENGTH=146 /DNA_ID=CAMNT_0010802129 /DNA_START=110 /DNA_END=546 /DNA_ORIENTATION=+
MEIQEDFSIELEYSTTNFSSTWAKRGTVSFYQKNSHGGKVASTVLNEDINSRIATEITQECVDTNGFYALRFKLNNQYYYSNIEACSLLESLFNDKLVFSFHDGVVSTSTLEGFSYEATDANINIEKNKPKGQDTFTTSVGFVKVG